MNTLIAVIKKDLLLFISDRSAAIMALLVPIGIGWFLASINLSGAPDANAKPKPIEILAADSDQTDLSKLIIEKIKGDDRLKVTVVTADEAKKQVNDGKSSLAMVIPKDFTKNAPNALLGKGERPEVQLVVDPTQRVASLAARGALINDIMKGLESSFRPDNKDSDPESSLPFKFTETTTSTKGDQDRNATGAHVFIGMAVQGVLFYAINLGMGLLRDRQHGIWKRLRSAPISLNNVILGKTLAGFIIACFTFAAVFLFGVAVIHIHIAGPLLGFVLIAAATALMAACFGMFVAALGKTESQSRGLSIFAVLAMSMLGGAWFPRFLMPEWFQKVTTLIPTSWAVDGLDGATWRGYDLTQCVTPFVVLLGFSALLFGIAALRFKSTESLI